MNNLFDLLEDSSRMLSAHGVRSLSAKDQFYQLDSNMYRGNIFVHLNYMLLRGLKTYYMEGSPALALVDKPELTARAAKIYKDVQKRLVDTVEA